MKRRLKKKVKIIFIIIIVIVIISFFNKKEDLANEEVKNKVKDEVNNKYVSSYTNDTYDLIKNMQKKDKRVKKILDNYDDYPSELLEMLSRNDEMIDFVLDFNEKKGSYTNASITNVKQGSAPLLMQWDKRWGYAAYADSYLAINGCAPTCLSMVIIYLTGDTSMNPYVISKYAYENGYYTSGVGTSWALMTKGSKHFGVSGKEIPLSKDVIYNSLKNGKPIICSMKPGDFTTTGHFIVLAGIKDGKIKVNDPNSKKRSSKLWEYGVLKDQIKNLWQFSLY